MYWLMSTCLMSLNLPSTETRSLPWEKLRYKPHFSYFGENLRPDLIAEWHGLSRMSACQRRSPCLVYSWRLSWCFWRMAHSQKGNWRLHIGIPFCRPWPQIWRPAADQHSDFIHARFQLSEVSALLSPEHHHCLLHCLEVKGHGTQNLLSCGPWGVPAGAEFLLFLSQTFFG